MFLSHGIFRPVQTVENQLTEVRETDLTGNRVAEFAFFVDQIDHVLLTAGNIDVFTDFDIAIGAQQGQATVARKAIRGEPIAAEVAGSAVVSGQHRIAKIFELWILRVIHVAYLACHDAGVAVAGIEQELLNLVAADIAQDAAEEFLLVEPARATFAFAVRAATYDRLGGFDEEYFLYWEDVDLSHRVLDAGLMPIIEPEVSIEAEDKQDAERRLVHAIVPHLDHLGEQKVALKLTLPTVPGFYADLIAHPNVARVVALSGGYDRDEANLLLAQNPGLIASFSRALLEGLSADQGDDEFDRTLNTSIEAIYRASLT